MAEIVYQIGDRVLVKTTRMSQASLSGKIGIIRGYQGRTERGEEMFRVDFPDGRVRTFTAGELELWFKVG